MEIKRVDGYFKHGCSFTGKLAVIDYSEDWKRHPHYGEFGSMSMFDISEKAEKLAKERYPNCEILLSIPDLVIRIE